MMVVSWKPLLIIYQGQVVYYGFFRRLLKLNFLLIWNPLYISNSLIGIIIKIDERQI